jgi:hypothetical protein
LAGRDGNKADDEVITLGKLPADSTLIGAVMKNDYIKPEQRLLFCGESKHTKSDIWFSRFLVASLVILVAAQIVHAL